MYPNSFKRRDETRYRQHRSICVHVQGLLLTCGKEGSWNTKWRGRQSEKILLCWQRWTVQHWKRALWTATGIKGTSCESTPSLCTWNRSIDFRLNEKNHQLQYMYCEIAGWEGEKQLLLPNELQLANTTTPFKIGNRRNHSHTHTHTHTHTLSLST